MLFYGSEELTIAEHAGRRNQRRKFNKILINYLDGTVSARHQKLIFQAQNFPVFVNTMNKQQQEEEGRTDNENKLALLHSHSFGT